MVKDRKKVVAGRKAWEDLFPRYPEVSNRRLHSAYIQEQESVMRTGAPRGNLDYINQVRQKLNNPERSLDVGCGIGHFAAFLANSLISFLFILFSFTPKKGF